MCVLKGAEYLDGEVRRLQREAFGAEGGTWSLDHRFHHGGFARSTPGLRAFTADFTARHGFAPEAVYVSKALFAVLEGGLGAGRDVVVVVTGAPL
ncbi:hypothetical protein Pen01_31270 [Phytomonospora endophytica]|nr:hypothetical protein Pen01_31270 [Phytomonospora endophytica]